MKAHYVDKKYVYKEDYCIKEFTDVYLVLQRGPLSKKVLIIDNLNCPGINLRVGFETAKTFKLKNVKDWIQDV